MIRLSANPFDPSHELSKFTSTANGAGGIVSFLGCVRPTSANGKVKKLFLQSYEPMTELGIQQTTDAAHQKWALVGLSVVHRIGDVYAGQPIVFVAAASEHRRAAFEATDFVMDYLKTKAVFWKKEFTDRGEMWIEPREQDYNDAKRWNMVESLR